jgi:hypothetical protein
MLGMAIAGLISAKSAAADLSARYDVMVGTLQIGKATISGSVGKDGYALKLNTSMTGLIGAVAGGKGAATTRGGFARGRPVAGAYALTASNGQVSRSIRLGFGGGEAARVAVDPPFSNAKDRVPVTAAHRRGVVDPLSAVLMPIRGGEAFDPANCDRTLPVFDGAQRFDVELAFERVDDVKVRGYEGPVLVCRARYKPLAGHFPDRPQTKFMVANRDIFVQLAPLAGARVLAPVRIDMKTAVGTMVIRARSFPGDADATATASVQ